MRLSIIIFVSVILLRGMIAQNPGLEINSNGVSFESLTNQERDALINPQSGMLIFNTSCSCLQIYRGCAWYDLCNGGQFVLQPVNALTGTMHEDESYDIELSKDGGYVIVGGSNGNGTITKLNVSGDTIWNVTLGGNEHELFNEIRRTNDGHFIAFRFSRSSNSGGVPDINNGESDFWVVKIDAHGNVLWNKLYGGNGIDVGEGLVITQDGGCIVTGYSASSQSGDVSDISNGMLDIWLLKLDEEGAIEWDKLLGGNNLDATGDIKALQDGGYVLCAASASTISGDVSEDTNGSSDYWVVRLNENGDILWDKMYGGGDSDSPHEIVVDQNGDFVIAGYSMSSNSGDVTHVNHGFYDVWVIKLDSEGNLLWNKLYGGVEEELAWDVIGVSTGGYLITGQSRSSNDGDVQYTNHGESDFWLLKLDVNGGIVWSNLLGGTAHEDGYAACETDDGGFIVTGTSASSQSGDVTSESAGGDDRWTIKLDAEGRVDD